MKSKPKKILGLLLALSMIFSLIPGMAPLKAQARELAHGDGNIYMSSSSSYTNRIVDMTGKYPSNPPKGVSYNKSTNTLTLKNANYPDYRLKVLSMGDLNIELKGTNKLLSIDASGHKGESVSLTFTGNGKILMNSSNQYGQRNCYIMVIGGNAKLTFGKNVSADIKAASGSTPITIGKDDTYSSGSAASYLKISGSHSSGSLKWKPAPYYWYEWNKQQFTKSAGSSSGSSTKKTAPAKPSQVKNVKGKSANKKATFTWKKLTKNCTGYQVQLSYNSKFKSPVKKTIKGKTSTKTTFSKLKAGKYVYFRIRAYNTKNKKTKYGKWSKTVKVTVKKGSSSKKKSTTSSSEIKNFKATSPSARTVKLTWTPVGNSCSGYQFNIVSDAGVSFNIISEDKNRSSAVHDSLISGRYYTFKMRARYTKNGKTTYGAWTKAIKVKVK